MAVLYTTNRGNKIRTASYELTRDIQGLYNKSLQTGKIHRLAFQEDRQTYLVQEFLLPKPKPSEEDEKAFEEWKRTQEVLEKLSTEDRANLSRLDRGSFQAISQNSLPSAITVKSVKNVKVPEEDQNQLEKWFIFFYPSGEMDETLIVLESDDGRLVSLITDPLQGLVRVEVGEVSASEWKEKTKAH